MRRRRTPFSSEGPHVGLSEDELLAAIRSSRVASTQRTLSTADPLQVELCRRRNDKRCQRCRWCLAWCPSAPRTFCGPVCLHEWKLRSRPTYLRRHVERRDRGVCRACGVDTVAWRARVWREYDDARTHRPPGVKIADALAGVLGRHGVTEHDLWRRSLWEADHIVPVARGGGLCGLDGIQTLCLPCHRARAKGVNSGL